MLLLLPFYLGCLSLHHGEPDLKRTKRFQPVLNMNSIEDIGTILSCLSSLLASYRVLHETELSLDVVVSLALEEKPS